MRPEKNPISKAIALADLNSIAKVCGVSRQAVRRWENNGYLPRTEASRETSYIDKILSDKRVAKGGLKPHEFPIGPHGYRRPLVNDIEPKVTGGGI